jgi:hypothetical protein
MRTFVLLGKFEATLLSSTPDHSPILACAAHWLSTTMIGFTSAAKAPAPQAVTPCLYDLRVVVESRERQWKPTMSNVQVTSWNFPLLRKNCAMDHVGH